LYVIPNGIDHILFFLLDANTARFIQEQRLFEAEFLMGQPSRLHWRKHMELSIRVIRSIHDLGGELGLTLTWDMSLKFPIY
jgi:hypothetical protein